MNSHCKGQFSKSNFRKVVFLKVFIFGDMNEWNMPVNINILLIDDFCWYVENGILRHYFSKATVVVDVLRSRQIFLSCS